MLAAARHAVDGLGEEGHLEAVPTERLLDHDAGQQLVVRGLQRARVAPVDLELLHDAVEAARAAHRGLDAADLLVAHLGAEAVALEQVEGFLERRAHGSLGALPVGLLQHLGDREAFRGHVRRPGCGPRTRARWPRRSRSARPPRDRCPRPGRAGVLREQRREASPGRLDGVAEDRPRIDEPVAVLEERRDAQRADGKARGRGPCCSWLWSTYQRTPGSATRSTLPSFSVAMPGSTTLEPSVWTPPARYSSACSRKWDDRDPLVGVVAAEVHARKRDEADLGVGGEQRPQALGIPLRGGDRVEQFAHVSHPFASNPHDREGKSEGMMVGRAGAAL